jgi:transcriptional regulator with GAF, ATPase, and Fis domain
MLGQAIQSKTPRAFAALPDRAQMNTALLSIAPRSVYILPMLYNDEVIGVLELGALKPFSETQQDFLNAAIENIAIAFNTAHARDKIDELLIKTQQQAEELQNQQEELRVANEELEAQTASLRAALQKSPA